MFGRLLLRRGKCDPSTTSNYRFPKIDTILYALIVEGGSHLPLRNRALWFVAHGLLSVLVYGGHGRYRPGAVTVDIFYLQVGSLSMFQINHFGLSTIQNFVLLSALFRKMVKWGNSSHRGF